MGPLKKRPPGLRAPLLLLVGLAVGMNYYYYEVTHFSTCLQLTNAALKDLKKMRKKLGKEVEKLEKNIKKGQDLRSKYATVPDNKKPKIKKKLQKLISKLKKSREKADAAKTAVETSLGNVKSQMGSWTKKDQKKAEKEISKTRKGIKKLQTIHEHWDKVIQEVG